MMKKKASRGRLPVVLYKRRLVGRRSELLGRLQAIERDFEQPRDPDDEDRATELNNDEVLDRLGSAGQQELLAHTPFCQACAHAAMMPR